MSQCLININSAGISSSSLEQTTATSGDVLSGKVIVGKDGELLTGTMSNRGAWNSSVGVNGSVTIPAGYHNGAGRVTNSVSTMGGQTITPTSSQQTISCSGKYMTGNVVINGVSTYSTKSITITKTGNTNNTKGTVYEFRGSVGGGITPIIAFAQDSNTGATWQMNGKAYIIRYNDPIASGTLKSGIVNGSEIRLWSNSTSSSLTCTLYGYT